MTVELFRLDGRVALVTGAARGLGQGLALGLARAGAGVMVVDRLPVDDTVAALTALDVPAAGQVADLADVSPARASALIGATVAALGRIDIVVNNAGILRRAAALEVPEQDWRQVIDINLNTPFFLSQAAGRHWVGKGERGKIINLASMLSFQGGLLVPSYAASKSAVAGLTRALATEWAPHGINVNALAPGYMATEMTGGIREDAARNQSVLDRIPAGRWGTPDDLHGPVAFLAAPASDYLHGVILPVDGGWLVR